MNTQARTPESNKAKNDDGHDGDEDAHFEKYRDDGEKM